LVDIQGRILFQSGSAQTDWTLNLQDKAAGIYFVQFRQEGRSWIEKITNY
jgi:hypothetical protein